MSHLPAPPAVAMPLPRLTAPDRHTKRNRATRPMPVLWLPPRLLLYIVVATALVVGLTALAGVQQPVRGIWFVATDAAGAALALATGAIGLTYFRSFGARSLLFVSIGFLGAGVLHGLHLLLQLDPAPVAIAGDIHQAAATSAAASQVYLASLLLMGWRASEGRISQVSPNVAGAASIMSWSGLALALLVVLALVLSRGSAPAPGEDALRITALGVGLAYSLSLATFLFRGDWRDYAFQHGFILLLLCVSASQFALLFGSAETDGMLRFGADSARNLGYAIAFVTLLASTSGLLKQVSDKRLATRIEALIESQTIGPSEWGEQRMLAPIGHRLQGAGTFELDLATGRFRGSPVTARLFGSAAGIQNLEQFASLVHSGDGLALQAALERSKREGVLFKQQFRIKAAGDGRWLEAIAGVESADGKPARLLGFIDDITARKSLELERDRLHAALQQMIAAVDQLAATATLNADGTIRAVNARFCALCGLPTDSVIGHQLGTLLRTAPGTVTLPTQLSDLDPESPWFGEVRLQQADGSARIAQASLSPHHVHGGDRNTLVFVGFDVTDRVNAERALQESVAAHRKSNEDLQLFAHIVSHDLQEPLRMVSSFMTLLERRYAAALPPEAREFIQFAVEGAQRMRNLLEGLLEYSHVNSQGGAFERINLERCVAGALSNLTVLIGETAAKIDVGALPEVRADPSQVVQLFQNLLANAIKFCPHRTPSIRVEGRRERGCAIVTVSDNGIGIDPAHYERIFQIFQRLHGRGDFAGTGVGLAVCKRIMERHGGTIELESKRDEGTTFRLEFPGA
jgi:PAS domain S-box-containing protein